MAACKLPQDVEATARGGSRMADGVVTELKVNHYLAKAYKKTKNGIIFL